MKMESLPRILFHCMMILFLAVGTWDMFYDYEENGCQMTYMFEYPQYLKVSTQPNSNNEYSLYLYGEGQYFTNIQSLRLQGVPVLFIPGHAGSYKQARSLGSVLLRKAIDKPRATHFNVFTIDFQEELVALYGGTLMSQSLFVHESIKHILSLYAHAQFKPKSVVLVGHSIGGIIARGVFTLDDFDPSMVSTIITLGTPNVNPVLNVDSIMNDFYVKINKYWDVNAINLSQITVVSIAGGERDFQVRSALTRLHVTRINSTNYLSTVTRDIPNVRVSVDHRCLAWCKQLYLVITRFLFDSIDPQRKQITESSETRHHLMRYYFDERNENSKYFGISSQAKPVKLTKTYTFLNISNFLWTVSSKKVQSSTYFSFHVKDFAAIGAANFICRTDVERKKWILGCKLFNGNRCLEAFDLSHHSIRTAKYQVVHLNLEQLNSENYTQILLPYSKSESSKVLDVNILSDLELSVEYTAPHVFSNLWTFNYGYDQIINKDAHIKMTDRFYYKVNLNGFLSIYQSFRLTLLDDGDLHVEMPWDKSQSLHGKNSVLLKLQTSPSENDSNTVIHVYTHSISEDPVILNLKVDFFQVLGQIVRHLGAGIPVYVVANVLIIYHYQLNQLRAEKPCHSITYAHSVSAKPYKIQPFVSLLKVFFGFEWFLVAWNTVGLPVPDTLVLEQKHREWFAFAPFVLFLFAYELFTLSSMFQKFLIYIMNKVPLVLPGGLTLSYFKGRATLPILHSIILSVLIPTASPLALLYMYVSSFLHVAVLHKGIVRIESTPSDVKNTERKPDKPEKQLDVKSSREKQPDPTSPSEDRFSVNFVLCQLWLWLYLFTVPSTAFWITKLRANLQLERDPFVYHAAWASLLFILQSFKGTHAGILKSRLSFLSWLFTPVIVSMVLFSVLSLYRVPSFILAFLTMHTIFQFV